MLVMSVRTRFAPSPTGMLHVGAIRTALFAWIIAKQNNGDFILRIEDTDKKREVKGAVEQIKESLKWLGLEWHEGPDVGGENSPYFQSQRLDIYKKYARQLLEAGHAYPDPYTQEQLEEFRGQSKNSNKPFLFRDYRPEFSDKSIEWDETKPLRLKVPEVKPYSWQDEVRGKLSAGPEALDDFILIKADGFPTYNFAHIVDDYEMKITHVIRGEEFISSMPKFLSVYDALGWQPPKFITLPPVLGKNGGKKLSKREGAMSVLEYRDQGYLKEAVFNFLSSLGWNDGTNQEVYSIDEILNAFSIERIQKSPARFEPEKLSWLNGHHIRSKSIEQLFETIKNQGLETGAKFWPEAAGKFDNAYKTQVLKLVQERLKHFDELPQLTKFFFEDQPIDLELIKNNKQLSRFSMDEIKALLKQTIDALEQSDFSIAGLTDSLNNLLQQTSQKPGVLFSLVRIATTWAPFSPPLAETLAVLGKETTIRRLNIAISNWELENRN